ncbi:VCBS repeat-containing protein [Streptomyces sp. NPDC006711]|uniref:FG-GAP repeat domain-containing protein n=1 Tax=unclassified Streptomyces TaxID=2593676 RepID=UPI0033C9A9E1
MRTKRASRLAACTALALSAGLLLAGPATADGGAPHLPLTPPKTRPAPTLTLPHQSAGARKAPRAAVANGQAKAKPLFDVDNDGRSDLLYRAPNDKLYVSPDNGTPAQTFANSLGAYKDLITPGDLGGSSAPEVLDLSPTGILTLHADVTMSGLGPGSWSGSGWNMYNKVIAAGDVSGDGKNDLLARTPSGDLYLYAGTGNLSEPFAAGQKIGSGWNRYDQIIGTSDVNGDGLGDIYGRTPGGDLYFYAGTGTSDPLASGVKVGWGFDAFNQLIPAGDQTGDGLGDIYARDLSGQLWYYTANGDGALKSRLPGGKNWQGIQLFGAGNNPAYGKDDLVGLDANGTLSSYWGLGNGDFSPATAGTPGGWKGVNYLSLPSSLNTSSRWASILEVASDGELFVDGNDLGGGWNAYDTVIGVGDLTTEGNGDLLARQPGNGHLYLYPGNGQSTGVYSRIDVGGGWNAYDKLVGAGDINGDGLPDLLARTPGGDLYFYAGTGRASTPFESRVRIGPGWDMYSGSKIAVPGDLTGDGRSDLVAVDSSGTLWRYDADGTGNFKARQKVGNGWDTYKYGIY